VPVFAVFTNPPMLGFEMLHSEKGTVISAKASIWLPSRSADTVNDTVLVVPCMSSAPVAW